MIVCLSLSLSLLILDDFGVVSSGNSVVKIMFQILLYLHV